MTQGRGGGGSEEEGKWRPHDLKIAKIYCNMQQREPRGLNNKYGIEHLFFEKVKKKLNN